MLLNATKAVFCHAGPQSSNPVGWSLGERLENLRSDLSLGVEFTAEGNYKHLSL